MSDLLIANIFRFIGIFLVQILILKNVDINTNYINLYIYPLFILLLPIKMQRVWVLLIAFVFGLSIDFFYDSPGVHAAASVFIAFIRTGLFRIMEPRGGYDTKLSPNKHNFGMTWFTQYTGILMFLHLFLIFMLDVFDMGYLGSIFLKTILSYILSMLLLIIFTYVFNPKI